MPRQSKRPAAASFPDHSFLPLPIPDDLWRRIAASMQLSKQHARIIENVLRGMSDKQIQAVMHIRRSTLRTYFDRIAYQTGLRGRPALFRHVLALSHQLTVCDAHQKSDGIPPVVQSAAY